MLSNPKQTKNKLVNWIRDYFKENGPKATAVIGISGGKDSTIAAALCAEALGAWRVLGVMMPDGAQDADSERVVEGLGIPHITVQLSDVIEGVHQAVISAIAPLTKQATINLPPRIRMATLYAVAQSLSGGGRVVNTCNYSEDYVGYSTKFGDSAGDFSPLGGLTVEEVKQIGYELGLPKDLVDKVPSDGLCGKTDEDNLGFTYKQLEDYIYAGTSGDMMVDRRISQLHEENLHKLNPMPVFHTKD